MGALYNDIESYAVELLNLRIKDGWLPQGEVSNEDIRTLSQKDLSTFNHIHLFAGIGGFPLAARMAGVPDDFKLFTAGFPCQPFSNAGARAGTNDNRYLWPETLCALKSQRPDVAILENVAGLVSMAFPNNETLMDVQTLTAGLRDYHYSEEALAVVEQIAVDVEEAGYTVQALIIPACAVDAKHRRDRIWFVCLRANGFNAHTGLSKSSRRADFKESNNRGGTARKQAQCVSTSSCGHGNHVANTRCLDRRDSASAVEGRNETRERELHSETACGCRSAGSPSETLADSDRTRKSQQTGSERKSGLGPIERREDVADTKSGRRRELGHGHKTQGHNGSEKSQSIGGGAARKENVSDSAGGRRKEQGKSIEPLHSAPREAWQTTQFINGGERCEWSPEPAVGRVVNGLSGRVDRIKGLGNAIVAQVAAEILTHILRALSVTPVFVFPFGEAS